MKKNLKLLVLLGFVLIMPLSAIIWAATEVKNLRTEYLRNPVGIDVTTPRFSWEMSSDTRGTAQTAYEITVSSDKEGSAIIWKSGKIESDKSLNIKYAGDTLKPKTRYYWHVDVWDNVSSKITSNETGYFETGILDSGWGDAKWLKATTKAQSSAASALPLGLDPSKVTSYSIKMDFEIKDICAGVSFGAKDGNNFFMWQISIEKGYATFRPHKWVNGGAALVEEKNISSLIDVQKGVKYAIQIDITGDKATTYINGIMIDENRVNPNGGNYGYSNLAFRQARAGTTDEAAYFDNVKVTTLVDGGKEATLFQQNFTSPTNFCFSAGTVTDGRLLVSNQFSIQKPLVAKINGIDPTTITAYTVKLKFNIKALCAGPCFGEKDPNNFFMWQINNQDGKSLFRPHSWQNGGGANHENKDISSLIKIESGVEYAMQIDINGDKATTYINGIMIDENRVNPRGGNYGFYNLGFRMDRDGATSTNEEAYFDSLLVTTVVEGKEVKMFEENFSSPTNFAFNAGTATDGRLFLSRQNSWQKPLVEKINGIDPTTITDYTMKLDFKINALCAGPCFGAKDPNNYFMWQINNQNGKSLFRPHSWLNGGGANHEDKDISSLFTIQNNVLYNMQIDIKGDKATTYLNGVMIDENRVNPRGGNYGFAGFGFRQAKDGASGVQESASFDNLSVTTIVDGKEVNMLKEDFSLTNNIAFSGGTVTDGRLNLTEQTVWQKPIATFPKDADLSTITDYTVKMDINIKALCAGACFAAKDPNNYFMWQINNQGGKSLFRPHSWQNGGGANHEDKDISSLIKIENNVTYALQIDVSGDKATTYLNGIMIDENRVNPRGGNYGFYNLAFRQNRDGGSNTNEEAYFDNVNVTTKVNGTEFNVFAEDFSTPTNFAFSDGSVVDGRLYLNNQYAIQKAKAVEGVKYSIDMDMTLKKDNAGIIFSATDVNNMYMWSFNTKDKADQPFIRRHFCVNGNFSTSEALLGTFFSKADLIDHERHVRIEVDNNVIKTYVDSILVDTYNDASGRLINGFIGFRSAFVVNDVNEAAYYDSIVVKDGLGKTTFSENFENGSNDFDNTETIDVAGNTKLNMFSKTGDTRVLQGNANGIPMFRSVFTVDNEVQSARVYTSALGVFDLFINGQRVGAPQEDGTTIYDELKPGATEYTKRAMYLTYDVTKLLQAGNNAVGAQVSSGWYNGNVSHGMFGSTPGFISLLEIKYTDGSTKTVVTDPTTWVTSSTGPVKMGDIYNGETYDARKESNWSAAEFNDAAWFMTAVNTEFRGQLNGFVGPTVQIRKGLDRIPVKITTYNGTTSDGSDFGKINTTNEVSGQAVTQLKKGETVIYDLGQNMAGWVKFTVKGAAGSKMTLRFAEMLNSSGKLARGDDGAVGSIYTANLRSAKATLAYTLKGGDVEETYNPSTTFMGFRYCEVKATQDVEIQSLVGQVVGSANEEGSTFETSNSLVNQLYSNIIWGQRGNFVSIPTDCPQRDERQGWTGDAQVFCRTAAYNADVAAFFHKWMNDMRDSQREDGAYPSIAPYMWGVGHGQGAWSEAGIIVPWTIYQMYADNSIIEENYASMEKYMKWLAAQTGDGYKYNGAGTAYGDWLSTEGTDSRYVSVCYYAYAAQLMSKMSKALSVTSGDAYDVKAADYKTLYNDIKAEFQTRYVTPAGVLRQNSQTTILLALKLDLYPTESAKKAGINLLRIKIATNGNKLTTGFLGTGTLNQTLSMSGEHNTAYNLLLQRNYPSWLYSVDQGATTIWERWNSYTVADGFNDVGMNSFNHYSYGAVAEWMYRYMAGIDVDEANPGFKNIILQPTPDMRTSFPTQGQITNVNAKHRSYYGDIESKWTMSQGVMTYVVKIPANTTATLSLPSAKSPRIIMEGTVPAEEAEGVTLVSKDDAKTTYTLKSGSYNFTVNMNVGIDKVDNGDFKINPNPVSQVLNIAKEAIDYRISDMSGNFLLNGKGVAVDVSKLSTGVYLLHSGKAVQKFIKE